MLIAEHSLVTCATPDAIWALWSDVEHWRLWDHEIKYAFLNGDFVVGSQGEMKLVSGPKIKFIIDRLNDMQSFTAESKLPMAKVVFTFELYMQDHELIVSHRAESYGPMARFYAKLLGKQMIHTLPRSLVNMVMLAEDAIAVV